MTVLSFIAQKVRSNVRDLEGALKRVLANAHFFGQSITLDFVRETLRDLIAVHDRQISLDNIQRMVADYFKNKNFRSIVEAPQSLSGKTKASCDGFVQRTYRPFITRNR